MLSTAIALPSGAPSGYIRHSRGYVRQPKPVGETISSVNITEADIAATPTSVDWSKQGALTPIKDQARGLPIQHPDI